MYENEKRRGEKVNVRVVRQRAKAKHAVYTVIINVCTELQ